MESCNDEDEQNDIDSDSDGRRQGGVRSTNLLGDWRNPAGRSCKMKNNHKDRVPFHFLPPSERRRRRGRRQQQPGHHHWRRQQPQRCQEENLRPRGIPHLLGRQRRYALTLIMQGTFNVGTFWCLLMLLFWTASTRDGNEGIIDNDFLDQHENLPSSLSSPSSRPKSATLTLNNVILLASTIPTFVLSTVIWTTILIIRLRNSYQRYQDCQHYLDLLKSSTMNLIVQTLIYERQVFHSDGDGSHNGESGSTNSLLNLPSREWRFEFVYRCVLFLKTATVHISAIDSVGLSLLSSSPSNLALQYAHEIPELSGIELDLVQNQIQIQQEHDEEEGDARPTKQCHQLPLLLLTHSSCVPQLMIQLIRETICTYEQRVSFRTSGEDATSPPTLCCHRSKNINNTHGVSCFPQGLQMNFTTKHSAGQNVDFSENETTVLLQLEHGPTYSSSLQVEQGPSSSASPSQSFKDRNLTSICGHKTIKMFYYDDVFQSLNDMVYGYDGITDILNVNTLRTSSVVLNLDRFLNFMISLTVWAFPFAVIIFGYCWTTAIVDCYTKIRPDTVRFQGPHAFEFVREFVSLSSWIPFGAAYASAAVFLWTVILLGVQSIDGELQHPFASRYYYYLSRFGSCCSYFPRECRGTHHRQSMNPPPPLVDLDETIYRPFLNKVLSLVESTDGPEWSTALKYKLHPNAEEVVALWPDQF